jgi:L-rhamnose isomerase
MAGRIQNAKPRRKGTTGNPGGRPRRKLVTDELERLLEEEAPDGKGKTWAALIAETLLKQARKGNVRPIVEIIYRVEGKARPPAEVSDEVSLTDITERMI